MNGAPLTYHQPVMAAQVVEGLAVRAGGTYIDCTLGDAGHAIAILDAALSDGAAGARLLGLDADPEAAEVAEGRLKAWADAHDQQPATVVNTNFDSLEESAAEHGFIPASGILFDLGLSSRQLDVEKRGFSFRRPEPLDMRFSPSGGPTAADLVNDLDEEDLADLIYRLGEEPRSRRIARGIVASRPIEDAQQLAEIVRRSAGYPRGRTHPATRTFQALRMAVNHEIESLQAGLEQAAHILGHGGRLVTIAYHSLEDREIKRFMSGTPSGETGVKPLSKKVVKPPKEEVSRNRRARSARLRVAEKR